MSKVINVGAESISLEITKPEVGFIPAEGQAFWVPDLMSLMEPTKEFVWRGSQSDYHLFYLNMVYKTPQEAFERYQVLTAVVHFLDN